MILFTTPAVFEPLKVFDEAVLINAPLLVPDPVCRDLSALQQLIKQAFVNTQYFHDVSGREDIGIIFKHSLTPFLRHRQAVSFFDHCQKPAAPHYFLIIFCFCAIIDIAV